MFSNSSVYSGIAVKGTPIPPAHYAWKQNGRETSQKLVANGPGEDMYRLNDIKYSYKK